MKKERQVAHRSLIEARDTPLYLQAATNLESASVSIVARAGDKCSYGGSKDTIPEDYEYIGIVTKGDIGCFYDAVRHLRLMRDGAALDPLERSFMSPLADSPDIIDNQSSELE